MKEALKLALEALEELGDTKSYWWQEVDEQTLEKLRHSITTIKEVLAKQEGQSNFCAQCEALARELKELKAQPEQGEPASVTYKEVADTMNALWYGNIEANQYAEVLENKKLYTFSPQRKPWVGLTDEQMRQICGSVPTMREAVREAEAILKEGNT